MNIIEQLDQEQMAEIAEKRTRPEFGPGDTVRVNVRVTEGTRTRIQAYEGVCIARKGGLGPENVLNTLSADEFVAWKQG